MVRHARAIEAGAVQGAAWGIHAANPFARIFRRRILPHLPGVAETLTMGSRKVF
jgi:hypothetical protein